MYCSVTGLDSRYTVVKDFNKALRPRVINDPVADYLSKNGIGSYVPKVLSSLDDEIYAVESMYDPPVKDIVEFHSSILQSRMEYRPRKKIATQVAETVNELLDIAHKTTCVMLLEILDLSNPIPIIAEKSIKVFTILKEEKKVDQYPDGTIFDSGTPYMPAFDTRGAPITDQYGTQLYMDPSGALFEAPRQTPRNTGYQQPNRNVNINSHFNHPQSQQRPTINTFHRESQPAGISPVIDNWSSGSVAINGDHHHTPVTTRVTVENNRPKMETVTSQRQASNSNPAVNIDGPWIGNVSQPYPLAYNPLKQQLLKINSNNAIVHDIKPLIPALEISKMSSDDWNYLEHELDALQRIRFKDERAAAVIRNTRMNTPAEFLYTPVSLADLKADSTIDITKPLTSACITLDDIDVGSIDAGINSIYSALINAEVSLDNMAGAVCWISKILTLTKEETVFGLDRLKKPKTLAKLALELRAMYALDGIASPFWLAVEDYLTKLVNNFLKFQIGQGIVISSFTEDAPELLSYILENNGDKVYSILLKHELFLIETFHMWLMEVKDNEIGEIDSNRVGTHYRQLIIVSNYTQLEFNLAVDSDVGYGILNPQQHGSLIAALQSMFNGNDITDSILIVFAGGTRGYFHQSAIIEGCIIFSLEK